MSKNSKQARVLAKARSMKMTKGPKSTTKVHTKVNTWYNERSNTYWRKPKEVKKTKDETEKAGLEFLRALKEHQAKEDRLRKMRDNM